MAWCYNPMVFVPGLLRKLFQIWTDQPLCCTTDEWRYLNLQLIQLASSLFTSTNHLLCHSAFTGEVIKGLVLLLHRELTEITNRAGGGLLTATALPVSCDSERVLVLRHGASLLHLLWLCDSSFTDHRAVVDQYYVHLVCNLIHLFQQMEGISQVEAMSLQEMRDTDQLEESSQDSGMDTTE